MTLAWFIQIIYRYSHASNTLLNVYVNLLVFMRIAGTS